MRLMTRLSWWARKIGGNLFLKLLTCILCAKILGVQNIYVGDAQYMLRRGFTSPGGITFWPNRGKVHGEVVLQSDFVGMMGGEAPWCSDWDLNRLAASEVRDEVLRGLPIPPARDTAEDTVAMQVRSGDIWRPMPAWTGAPHYGQPPCYFYLSLLPRFRRSIVLAIDDANPCVSRLVAAGAEWRRNGTEADRVALSAYSRNFVLSRSSFSRIALYLSPYPKKFYTFLGAELSPWDSSAWAYGFFRDFGPHENCVPSLVYQRAVMDWWEPPRAGSATMRLILNASCEWQQAMHSNWSSLCENPPHALKGFWGCVPRSYCPGPTERVNVRIDLTRRRVWNRPQAARSCLTRE
jgi:hypothetical protein